MAKKTIRKNFNYQGVVSSLFVCVGGGSGLILGELKIIPIMIEDTRLMDWAEELVDKIVASICGVISMEGVNNPVSVVEREYEKLSPEKQFLLQYVVAAYWGEAFEDAYEALAKQNVVDVWEALNFVP